MWRDGTAAKFQGDNVIILLWYYFLYVLIGCDLQVDEHSDGLVISALLQRDGVILGVIKFFNSNMFNSRTGDTKVWSIDSALWSK